MPAVTISEWLDEHLMSSWILMAKWQLNLPVGWSFIKVLHEQVTVHQKF